MNLKRYVKKLRKRDYDTFITVLDEDDDKLLNKTSVHDPKLNARLVIIGGGVLKDIIPVGCGHYFLVVGHNE